MTEMRLSCNLRQISSVDAKVWQNGFSMIFAAFLAKF